MDTYIFTRTDNNTVVAEIKASTSFEARLVYAERMSRDLHISDKSQIVDNWLDSGILTIAVK